MEVRRKQSNLSQDLHYWTADSQSLEDTYSDESKNINNQSEPSKKPLTKLNPVKEQAIVPLTHTLSASKSYENSSAMFDELEACYDPTKILNHTPSKTIFSTVYKNPCTTR